VLSHENRLANALFTANNVILRFFFTQDQNFSKIHKTEKKIFFGQNKKNKCLMILNDTPNCQVSRILMNPRPILYDSSENDPIVFRKATRTLQKKHHITLKKPIPLKMYLKNL
jgi:hypothetical protein